MIFNSLFYWLLQRKGFMSRPEMDNFILDMDNFAFMDNEYLKK